MQLLALVSLLASGGCALEVVQAPQEPPACALSEADRAWLERALEAWRFASREIAGIGNVPSFKAVFFDAHCVLTSDDALIRPTAQGVTWTAAPHTGTVELPDGSSLPVGVISFAMGGKDSPYFVMSTPSVWSAGGRGKGPDLERMMVAVMLHEASHVAQVGTYGPRLGALIERNHLPDSFNDNAVQDRFQSNQEFAASVKRETATFAQAAAAKDDSEAKLLAYEARELMRERAARWFVGDDAYFAEAEDLWLTYEGSGQWLAYQWLIHPRGGAQAPDIVAMTRDSQWSQAEGFALVLALERITGPGWKGHAYGDGARTVLEMLDEALKEG